MTKAGNPTTPAVGGSHQVPVPDPVARDYLLLALRLDQHSPGLVDAYFGPADLKAQVDMEQLRAPGRLAEDASALRERLTAEIADPRRREWVDGVRDLAGYVTRLGNERVASLIPLEHHDAPPVDYGY